ncbi:MAG TPA: methyltransferase [Sphingomicrobium sp.]|jgi:predicted methyltransferase|nr:methyltransferase [Sphingomicrobium sp.]
MRPFLLAFALASLASTAPAAPAAPASKTSTIAAAVASPSRDADNVKLDEGRKPAQVLAFLGLKPGMHVLDLFGANRYWSEIMAPVVGPKGHVAVWNPSQFYSDKTKAAFEAFETRTPNVSIVVSPFEAPALAPDSADFVILNDNYHDTYWQNAKYGIPQMDPAAFVKAVYAAMKPGAVIGVIDHIANPNDDTRATVEKLHRIDPAVVKADFERAGFEFVGSSDILRNPADDHTLLVFDPKVKGHTDRFIFKFRKPA